VQRELGDAGRGVGDPVQRHQRAPHDHPARQRDRRRSGDDEPGEDPHHLPHDVRDGLQRQALDVPAVGDHAELARLTQVHGVRGRRRRRQHLDLVLGEQARSRPAGQFDRAADAAVGEDPRVDAGGTVRRSGRRRPQRRDLAVQVAHQERVQREHRDAADHQAQRGEQDDLARDQLRPQRSRTQA
jgi:hypothetical protein